ncbi:hypothetical protein M8J77_015125 [Diaphorina citri]|nr:hypothetical protein M8J77_015125 [Diaphorina citri]
MKIVLCAVTLFCLLHTISGAFVQCKRKDPKLNECLVEQINKNYIPISDKAFPQYGVPSLDPHALGDIRINQGNQQIGLNFSASDVQFYGLRKAVVQKVDLNPKTREFSLKFFNKRFVQLNKYEAKGKILLFPINGHGMGNITTTDVAARISFKYDLVTDPKTKVKHVKVRSLEFKARPGKGYLSFENLFNGDKYLSKQINEVINENSAELMPTFQPSVELGLSKAWKKLVDDFFARVPYDDLFLP